MSTDELARPTSVVAHHPWLDAVAGSGRRKMTAAPAALTRVVPEGLVVELESFAGDTWRARTAVVAHGRAGWGRTLPLVRLKVPLSRCRSPDRAELAAVARALGADLSDLQVG